MQRTTKSYNQLFTYISTLFPKLDTELNYETPFQLLVAVMLSAQSTDKQVNKITDQLFKTIKTPYDILKLWQENLEQAINSVNYYRMKAKHIFQTATLLAKNPSCHCGLEKLSCHCGLDPQSHILNVPNLRQDNLPQKDYTIPSTTEELMQLPGVGEKTAKVIQYVLYKKPVIAVDTHVHRVANRLWIVHTSQPLQTSKEIESRIPKKRKLHAHHALILFWRYYCKAIKPKCEECVLKKLCEFYQNK